MSKRTLVVDQLYNLAAGFLYALSICYFARGSDFAPGGISGLALIVNYLWHLPVGITTLVFNLPLVALSIRFVGRAFLAKSLVSMVWCTVFQDVVFARVGCYTGDPLRALQQALSKVRGSYALVLLAKDKLIGIRDPYGIRPLCLGRVGNSFVLASESCALDAVGAEFVRDVQPGEIVVIDAEGIHSMHVKTPMRSRLCLFEFVYFARPDSVIDGINVYQSRVEAGKRLAIDDDVEADMVIGVPDSALAAAMGYAQQSGIPYGDGLAKNRYVGRTFIQPEQGMRELGVRTKLNALTRNVRGKRLILVDDSIVRGTTSRKIVEMLRTAGAKEVHMRISSPSVLNPCYFGIDTATSEELIGHSRSAEEICRFIGADSLKFLSLPDLLKTVAGSGCQFCTGCFDGDYPIDPETGEMHGMEEEHDYV